MQQSNSQREQRGQTLNSSTVVGLQVEDPYRLFIDLKFRQQLFRNYVIYDAF